MALFGCGGRAGFLLNFLKNFFFLLFVPCLSLLSFVPLVARAKREQKFFLKKFFFFFFLILFVLLLSAKLTL